MDALKLILFEERWLHDESLVLILNMILVFGLEISVTPKNFVFVSLNQVVN